MINHIESNIEQPENRYISSELQVKYIIPENLRNHIELLKKNLAFEINRWSNPEDRKNVKHFQIFKQKGGIALITA